MKVSCATPVTFLITGTGTHVGKTVLCRWLIRRLMHHGWPVRAFKPLCSGGREDARVLWHAQRKSLPLDIINPWSFRTAVTPLLAARAEGIHVHLDQVLEHLRRHAPDGGIRLVEGAGGLLSPLGEDFSARDLITRLEARPIIVAVDRLGVLNEILLTWEALPNRSRKQAHWVLFAPLTADASTGRNKALLSAQIDPRHIHELPRVVRPGLPKPPHQVTRSLDQLLVALDLIPGQSVAG